MKKITFLLIMTAAVFILSCKKEKYEAAKAKTVAMAGRWWVELYQDADINGIPTEDELLYAYADFEGQGIVTSNTAADDADSVIINDAKESWPFKIKAPINLSALTFTPSTNLNIHPDYVGSGETVRIIEGKILKAAARSKSGAIADSIFLEFEFSDDAGTQYIYAGHRDSGFPEDHY